MLFCKIKIYLLIHHTHFSPSARHRYSVLITKINLIPAQRWYNVNVPMLDELSWSNIGTMSVHQHWQIQCWSVVGSVICSQHYNHMPTLGQRKLAIWDNRYILILIPCWELMFIKCLHIALYLEFIYLSEFSPNLCCVL